MNSWRASLREGRRRDCSDQDGWSLSKPNHRASNVPSDLSALLWEHIELQQCQMSNWIVSVFEVVWLSKEVVKSIASTFAPSGMVFVIPQDFNEGFQTPWSLEMGFGAGDAYKKPLARLWSVCKIYDINFRMLLDMGAQSGRDISERGHMDPRNYSYKPAELLRSQLLSMNSKV